jgi:hypothetical protein
MAQPGTILIRAWQSTAHRVTMLDDGVSFIGKRTVRSPKSRALSRAAACRVHVSLDYDRRIPKTTMQQAKTLIRRCAIYTRKSSEEGLEQDFNSLHAQREACEAFIKSQTGEGWRLVKGAYDDVSTPVEC